MLETAPAPTEKEKPSVPERVNRTGIPEPLKRRFETGSGLSLDDVRVHYQSEKPARLQALAYTQGNQVFIGPGQERHLPHELTHVVQQKRGLVKPTSFLESGSGRVPLNDDPALERQAESRIPDGVRPVAALPRAMPDPAHSLQRKPVSLLQRPAGTVPGTAAPGTVQRLAMRAMKPPKGQEALFGNLEKVAMQEGAGACLPETETQSLKGGTATAAGVVKTPTEPVAFLGHGSPTKIGDLTAADIRDVMLTVLKSSEGHMAPDALAPPDADAMPVLPPEEDAVPVSAPEEDTRLQTSWHGPVYLMGCKTGRAYRKDETAPLSEAEAGLADRVKARYNESIAPPVADVVGTFLSMYALESAGADGKHYGSILDFEGCNNADVYLRPEFRGPLHENPVKVNLYRFIQMVNAIPKKLTLILDVYCNTTANKVLYPIEGTTPSEIRKNAIECAKKMKDQLSNDEGSVLQIKIEAVSAHLNKDDPLCTELIEDLSRLSTAAEKVCSFFERVETWTGLLLKEVAYIKQSVGKEGKNLLTGKINNAIDAAPESETISGLLAWYPELKKAARAAAESAGMSSLELKLYKPETFDTLLKQTKEFIPSKDPLKVSSRLPKATGLSNFSRIKFSGDDTTYHTAKAEQFQAKATPLPEEHDE